MLSVAAVQLRAHDRERFDDVWPAMRERIADAASRAQLVVAPEGSIPAYVIGNEPVDREQIERAVNELIAVARTTGATIVIGSARSDDSGLANAALVITGDGVVGSAEKCFLWHFDRRWFRAGDALQPIDTPVGRLGVFICADGRIPTIAATLVERGAELLVVPTAWVTSGRDPLNLENIQADLMAAVRARENGVPLIAANKCGVEQRAVAYCGKSQIVDHEGRLLARAGARDPETIVTRVVLDPLRRRTAAAPGVEGANENHPLPERVRIAISAIDDRALLFGAQLVDAHLFFTPDAARPEVLFGDAVSVDDAQMMDPRALVAARLSGTRLFVWRNAAIAPEWIVPFARTRAAELRAYIVVFTRAGRAFAVDPDGVIVAGTFDDFAVAVFAYDRARTESWHVAPDTSVREGLLAVDALRAAPAV